MNKLCILLLQFKFICFGDCFVHIPLERSQHNLENKVIGMISNFQIDDKYNSYDSKILHEIRKKDWINRSVDYYFRVTREKTYISSSSNNNEERTTATTIDCLQHQQPNHRRQTKEQAEIATRLYFARVKVKDGSPHHAEQIYRKTINEIMSSDPDEYCDHSALAVSTLLLALLLQRMGDIKGTRSVFLNFFRIIQTNEEKDVEEEHIDNKNNDCACSAKVLQAFALFEMKRGNSIKSYKLVNKAVTMDKSLERVLKWKQFRDAGNKSSSKHVP